MFLPLRSSEKKKDKVQVSGDPLGSERLLLLRCGEMRVRAQLTKRYFHEQYLSNTWNTMVFREKNLAK